MPFSFCGRAASAMRVGDVSERFVRKAEAEETLEEARLYSSMEG